MTQEEEAQLAQTVEMFEVIAQTQPFDYQSLEILKEAYSKLGREPDAINTSKRIAHAYVQMGQFSSAILEYETILQHQPDDPEVQAALKEIESQGPNRQSTRSYRYRHLEIRGNQHQLVPQVRGQIHLHRGGWPQADVQDIRRRQNYCASGFRSLLANAGAGIPRPPMSSNRLSRSSLIKVSFKSMRP